MLNYKHTYKIGEINYCQICSNQNLKEILDLGFQPLADDLKRTGDKLKETLFYPLKINFCKKCCYLQTAYIVGDNTLYPKSYHYRPGITKDVVKNFSEMSKSLINKYSLNKTKDLIIDLGCNDGSLLNQFKERGFKLNLGVDPTDMIKYAKKKGIKTIQKFFDINTSKEILKKYGKAKLVTTTNVFAHTNNLYEFIKGTRNILKKDGVFVIENHYLLEVIKKTQFDTFYHEHLRTYSLKSLIKLMKYYKLHLIDAYTTTRYGGNIQAHFSMKKKKYNRRIRNILKKEDHYLSNINNYKKFKLKMENSKEKLRKYILKNKEKKIVGKAFPARASILLHYYNYLPSSLKYIAEQPQSKKLNFCAPGTNLKIISSEEMKKNNPDVVVVLAWHLFDTIYNKWKKLFKKKVKFIKILPKFEVL